MPIKFIDTHGHVNFAAYDADRGEVINRAESAGVATVTVGTDLSTSEKAVEISKLYSNCFAIIGIHPVHAGYSRNDPLETGKEGERAPVSFDKEEFLRLGMNEKVIAVGECGLDYFHSQSDEIQSQLDMFAGHIDLANILKKPIMLHVRNGKGSSHSAYLDALAVLKENSKVQFNFHFFAGTLEEMKSILEAGGYVSFTGAVTFGVNYHELIRYVPLDRIMSETDCPYVAPVPYRGKRNEPVYVIEVVKKIAEIKGVDFEFAAKSMLLNAEKFFGIKLQDI